jgi:hypothetical protein
MRKYVQAYLGLNAAEKTATDALRAFATGILEQMQEAGYLAYLDRSGSYPEEVTDPETVLGAIFIRDGGVPDGILEAVTAASPRHPSVIVDAFRGAALKVGENEDFVFLRPESLRSVEHDD